MSSLLMLAFAFLKVADVPYDPSIGAAGVGDLYVPERPAATTPIVLMIHGGGWYNGSRQNTVGIAEYFAKDLGFAVFNIEYRLGQDGNHWPACGDDCVAAAEFLLSDAFKGQYGFGYDKIWICGGSAGGHLALWTLVNLQQSKVAGVVAISPIGDPEPDYPAHTSRYTQLFDGAVDFAAMNPCTRVTGGMAPVLVTHATDDETVAIQSSKNFAAAYVAARNTVDYFEYVNDLEPNQGGHCIWRPDVTPHRLLDSIERRIAYFVRTHSQVDPMVPPGEITARAMKVSRVNYASNGRVSSVDIDFGAGNGLENNLYVAYGDTYGGDRIGDWEHADFVATIGDAVSSHRAYVPVSANVVKFFMDVPFPDGQMGEPVRWITADGSQYIDTGVLLSGGDTLKARFRPESAKMAVMGYRKTTSAADVNVNFVMSASKPIAFYSASGSYADYMMSGTACTLNKWYDIILSAAERSFVAVDSGSVHCRNGTVNADAFSSTVPCRLFHVAGSPSVTEKTVGSISSFRIERNGAPLAAYLPYKIGQVYGFYDRVTGEFFSAEETGTSFTGTDDATLSTPLTSATETIVPGRPTVEACARAISACSVSRSGGHDCIDVTFGPDNGYENHFYLAYDTADRGTDYRRWAHFVKLGIVTAATNSWRISVPAEARRCRFFLSLPEDGADIPVAVKHVTGDGTDFFDTGLKLKGGDEVVARIRPSGTYNQQIFGSRASSAIGRNVTILINGTQKFMVDYTDTGIEHRCTSAENAKVNTWYEIKAGPNSRTVTDLASGNEIGACNVECTNAFTTAYNAYLFGISGNTVVANRFSGDVASLTVKRNGAFELSLCPCVVGTKVGFYDRAGRGFMPASGSAFTASAEIADENPLVSVSEAVAVNRKGAALSFR